MARGTRPRCKRVEVWLTEEELATISTKAESMRLSRSDYLRSLGMGYQPKSKFDRDAIRDLMDLRADQGRLGGLLKLWLSERSGEGSPISSVRSVLQQIETLQHKLAKLVFDEAIRL
jgi:hypothetical protein